MIAAPARACSPSTNGLPLMNCPHCHQSIQLYAETNTVFYCEPCHADIHVNGNKDLYLTLFHFGLRADSTMGEYIVYRFYSHSLTIWNKNQSVATINHPVPSREEVNNFFIRVLNNKAFL